MTAMTNYLENKLIDHIFRGVAFSGPGTVYVGLTLSSGAPTDASAGTEVSGNNYARAAVSCTTTAWAATNGATTTTNPSSGNTGTTSNNAVITFNTPTGGNWGTVGYFEIWESALGGSNNRLFWGALSSPKLILENDAVSIQISQLQVQIDD